MLLPDDDDDRSNEGASSAVVVVVVVETMHRNKNKRPVDCRLNDREEVEVLVLTQENMDANR